MPDLPTLQPSYDIPPPPPECFSIGLLSRQVKLRFLHPKKNLHARRPIPDFGVRSIQRGRGGEKPFHLPLQLRGGGRREGRVTAGCDPSFAQTRVAMRMNGNWPGNGTTNLFVLRSVGHSQETAGGRGGSCAIPQFLLPTHPVTRYLSRER